MTFPAGRRDHKRAQVQQWLADIAVGRVRDFNAERIICKGEEQLAVRDACA